MGSSYRDLAVAFYFRVLIDSAEFLFKEASGFTVEMETENVAEGGVNNYEHHLPKQLKHGNLILKRALSNTQDWDVRWIKKNLEGDFSRPIEKKDIKVSLLNEKGVAIHSWVCANAFPVKWEIEALDSEKNSVLIESIEFSYTTLTRY